MKRFKRIDKIKSFKAFLCALALVFLFFAVSEFILRNFTSFGDTLSNLEYYASLSFSEEEMKTAIKLREEEATIGSRAVAVPGTIVYRYKTVRTESLNFNSFGFRGEEPKKKEENEFRIGFFGDSRVAAIYLGEENTLPYILQKRLQAEFPNKKITVYNTGVEGYDLPRAAAFAALDSGNLELDMAVFYVGANDVNISFDHDYAYGMWPIFEKEDAVYKHVIENEEMYRKKSFFQRSSLLNAIREAFLSDFVNSSSSMSKETVFRPLTPDFERKADILVANMKAKAKQTSDELAARGIMSAFFLPPLLPLKEPLSTLERNMLYKTEMDYPGSTNYSLRCAESFSESQDPVVFEQTYIFNGYSQTMFYDGLHFTPEGSRIVGNNVADRIIPMLKNSEKLK